MAALHMSDIGILPRKAMVAAFLCVECSLRETGGYPSGNTGWLLRSFAKATNI